MCNTMQLTSLTPVEPCPRVASGTVATAPALVRAASTELLCHKTDELQCHCAGVVARLAKRCLQFPAAATGHLPGSAAVDSLAAGHSLQVLLLLAHECH